MLFTMVLITVYMHYAMPGNNFLGPLAVAVVLATLTYITAPLSGGHLNPGITWTLGICGQFVGEDFLFKMVAYPFVQ